MTNNRDYQFGADAAAEHADIFRALADETRLRLLRLLFRAELNVQELCFVLQLAQPRISRHLAVLRHSGIVSDRREGPKVYYTLAEDKEHLQPFADYLRNLGQSQHQDLHRLEECLHQRSLQAQQFADRRADQWDELGKLLHSTSASVLALANLVPRGLTVADLGTGTGLLLPFLSSLADHVYAVDQSAAMLKHAQLRCRQLHIDNVSFIHQSLEEMAQKLPCCDGLLLHFVLHQVARPPLLLENLITALKPGGRLVVVDRLQHQDEDAKTIFGSLWLGFAQEQLQRWFAAAGLVDFCWHELSGTAAEHDSAFALFVAAAAKPR